MSNGYHEANLADSTMDVHRALTSLKEELEAVDWYNQRADATADAELRAVLEHNRDEEIEHACMLLEYLRRQLSAFDDNLKTFLFSKLPITQIEAAETAGQAEAASTHGTLGLGSLSERE